MINVVTGKTGHGKTAYCVAKVKEALEQGRKVYSNITVNPHAMFPKKKYRKLFGEDEIWGDIIKPEDRKNKQLLYWQNFGDWQFFEDGLVIVDEGIVYFNARNWEALPPEMQMRLVQHRKDQIDILINIQHYSLLEKTIRNLTESFVHCELKWGSPNFKKSPIPRIAKITEIDLPTLNRCENMGIDPYNLNKEELEKMHIDLNQESFWIHKGIFKWYDTSKKMVESRPVPLICRVQSAPCGFTQHKHA